MFLIRNIKQYSKGKLWRERGLSVLSNEDQAHVPPPSAPLGTPNKALSEWEIATWESSESQRQSPFKVSLSAMTVTASHLGTRIYSLPLPERRPAFQVTTLASHRLTSLASYAPSVQKTSGMNSPHYF